MKLLKTGLIIAFMAHCVATIVHANDTDERSLRPRSQRGLNGEDEGRYVSRRTRERDPSSPSNSRTGRPEVADDKPRKIHFDGHPRKSELPKGAGTNRAKKPGRKPAGDDTPKKGRGKNAASDGPEVKSTLSGVVSTTLDLDEPKASTGRNSAPDEPKRGRESDSNPTKDDSNKKIVRDKSPRNYYTNIVNPVPVVPVMNTVVSPLEGNLVPALTCQQEQCLSQPSEMRFYFTGNSCRDSYNHMGGNFMAYYDSLITTTSYLFVTDAARGDNVFYSGRVTPGETVLIDNDSLFPTELMVTVYDMQVTQVLQMFKIRSDCQANLVIGDTFCGVMVRQITNPVQGTFGTCVPANTYTPGPGRGSKSSKSGITYRGKSSKYVGVPAPIVPPPSAPSTQCNAPATMVRLQLTGGGCRASKPFNDQGKDFVCLLDRDLPMQSVRVTMVGASSTEIVFDQVVNMNDVIELTYSNGTLPTAMTAQITDLNSTSIQIFGFNPSCSVPLTLGDRIGAFTVVGFANQEQGMVTSGPAMPVVPTMPTAPMPTAPMPSPTPGSTSQCRGSLCTDPPRQLLFTFEGDSCASNKNSQGSDFSCAIDSTVTFPANVEITSSTDNSIVGFSGTINSKGQLVTVGDGSFVLPGTMTMVVMDSSRMMILQSVTFKTDCVTSLFIGDFYGAIKLVEFTHQGGTFGGCRDAA